MLTAVAAVVGVLFPLPASAAVPPGRAPGAVGGSADGKTGPLRFQQATGVDGVQSVINCEVLASPIRKSAATASGVGYVQCLTDQGEQAPMTYIDLRILLFRRSETGLAGEYQEVGSGRGLITGAADAPCRTDDHFTFADSYLVPPPGYEPPHALISDTSPFVRITC
ncbi:hypothetical protein AOZ06_25435 [Kibdelosporangium phytohabitans]|uniref:Secreted protein n=1 Tax=Kibdelosporangium phytohabitans TaxID=860235 RepID=A0A0N9I5U5_9PSEU|nr:hypothetical protein AOZ06_25435 [Kibdelosporangium phytohabitans]